MCVGFLRPRSPARSPLPIGSFRFPSLRPSTKTSVHPTHAPPPRPSSNDAMRRSRHRRRRPTPCASMDVGDRGTLVRGTRQGQFTSNHAHAWQATTMQGVEEGEKRMQGKQLAPCTWQSHASGGRKRSEDWIGMEGVRSVRSCVGRGLPRNKRMQQKTHGSIDEMQEECTALAPIPRQAHQNTLFLLNLHVYCHMLAQACAVPRIQ